jgi:hypothetical protein
LIWNGSKKKKKIFYFLQKRYIRQMLEISYNDLFKNAVELLYSSEFKKNEIAESLNIKKNSSLVDHSAFAKLCTGVLQSYKKRTIESLYNELINHPKYKSYFNKNPFNIISFDIIYIFYYWSYQNKTKAAIIGLNLKRATAGRLIYLEKTSASSFKEKYNHPVISQEFKNSETLDIRFNTKNKRSGCTFLSIHLGNKLPQNINLTYASFAGAMSNDQNQYCGIGVIQQIQKSDLKDFLNNLYTNYIPPSIINILYKKRFDVTWSKHDMFENIEELWGTQREPLRLLNGFWVGYYLRRLIDGPTLDGGLVKVIFHIQETGESTILFNDSDEIEDSNLVIYNGFLKFPGENNYQITVGEFQTTQNVNRLMLYLKPQSKTMSGMFCGWRSIDIGYFATPIYFEKIPKNKIDLKKTDDENIAILINEFKPGQYHRTKTNEFEDQIKKLREIQENVFETVEGCIGSNKIN